jgi:hypothetical protein
MNLRKIFIFVFFILFLESIFAAYVYTGEVEHQVYEIGNNINPVGEVTGNINEDYYYWLVSNSDYKIVGPNSSDENSPTYLKYQSSDFVNANQVCMASTQPNEPFIAFPEDTAENYIFKLRSNLVPNDFQGLINADDPSTTDELNDGRNVIKNHYFMKTLVFLEVDNGSAQKQYYLPLKAGQQRVFQTYGYGGATDFYTRIESGYLNRDDITIDLDYISSQYDFPQGQVQYVIFGDMHMPVHFSKDEISASSNCANNQCMMRLHAIPVDGKCDFGNNNLLNVNEFQGSHSEWIPFIQDTSTVTEGDNVFSGAIPTQGDYDPRLCPFPSYLDPTTYIPKFTPFKNQSGELNIMNEVCEVEPVNKPTQINKNMTVIVNGQERKVPIQAEDLALHIPAFKKPRDQEDVESN